MKHKEILLEYFKNFSNKDIESLQQMFADNVVLTDWEISASGKEEVIECNQNIFNSVDTIEVTPVNFYSNSDTSYAVQISILVNGKENLEVIDVIKFNDLGLINYIEAYKV